MGTLIKEGKLSHNAIPRLFYCGHKYLGSKYKAIRKYWCVDCQKEWEGNPKCPFCNKIDKYYYIDEDSENFEFPFTIWDITGDSQIGMWQCVKCKFEWESEDGTICPKCKFEKKN